MALQHSIESALAARIGADGVSDAALADALKRAGEALDWLRARHADGALRLLRLPAEQGDLAAIGAAAARLSAGASDVVFLGTGGSSLGGQTLSQLAGYGVPASTPAQGKPRLHFIDNLDPQTFAGLLRTLPLAHTHFVPISKSGG